MGSDGQKGTYRFVRQGKRYTYGQWPTEDPLVFQDLPDSVALAPTGSVACAVGACLVLRSLLVAPSCGLGAKQALTDRSDRGLEATRGRGHATGTIAADVVLVKSDKPLVPGPPKIPPAGHRTGDDLRSSNGSDRRRRRVPIPATAVLVFRGQRHLPAHRAEATATGLKAPQQRGIEPESLGSSRRQGTRSSPSASRGGEVVPLDTTTTSTSTTSPSALRRQPRIVRQWIAFDYRQIKDKDTTKQAGSYAINPTVLLDLVKGTLTGSIERSRPSGVWPRPAMTRT